MGGHGPISKLPAKENPYMGEGKEVKQSNEWEGGGKDL